MIDYLKTIITKLLRKVLKFLSLGTFHSNQVVFFSYFGKQYSCNPKYISEYLEKNSSHFKIIWAFNEPQNFSFLQKRGIVLKKYNSLTFLRTCLTSKFIITNSEIPSWFPITKKQLYINTWHGGGAYKRVGAAYQKETKGKQKRAQIAREIPCVYISSSKAFTELTIHGSFNHTGEILSVGMSRNDILVSQNKPELYEMVKTYYNIPASNHILLYAPTYRDSKKASEYLFDCEKIKKTLTSKWGGEWTLLFRMHYFIIEQLPLTKDYINASSYPDMQELLYVSDILVTDYSSSMWDFALTGKPCFLYATDLEQYDLTRGFYTNIYTWPFPLAKTFEQLNANINNFDAQNYSTSVQNHLIKLGSYESGTASKKIVDYMLSQ